MIYTISAFLNAHKILITLVFIILIPSVQADSFIKNFSDTPSKLSVITYKGDDVLPSGKYALMFFCLNGIGDDLTSKASIRAKLILGNHLVKKKHDGINILKTSLEYGQSCSYVYSKLVVESEENIDIDEISHELLDDSNSFTTTSLGKSKNKFRTIKRGTPRENALKDAKISAIKKAIIYINPTNILISDDLDGFRDLAAKVYLSSKKGLINKYRITAEYSKKKYFMLEVDITINIKKLKKSIKSLKRRSQSPIFYIDSKVTIHAPMIKDALKRLKIETTDLVEDAQIIVSAIAGIDDELDTFTISEPNQQPLYSWKPRNEKQISNRKFKRLFTTSLLLISSKGGTIYNVFIDRYTSPGLEVLEKGIKKMRGVQFESIKDLPYATEIVIRSNLQRHKVASRLMQYLSNYSDNFEMLLLRNKILQFKRPTNELNPVPTPSSLLIHKDINVKIPELISLTSSHRQITNVSASLHPNGNVLTMNYFGDNDEFVHDIKSILNSISPKLPIPYSHTNHVIHLSMSNTSIPDKKPLMTQAKEYANKFIKYFNSNVSLAYDWSVAIYTKSLDFIKTLFSK